MICQNEVCTASGPFRILEARENAAINKAVFCAEHARPVIAEYTLACAKTTPSSVPYKLACIVTNDESHVAVVYLTARDASCFMFTTGPCEAWSLGALLALNIDGRRPILHEVTAETIAGLGGTLSEVVIDSIVGDVYHAKLQVAAIGRRLSIDVRPSDAVGVAIVTGAPIQIHADVVLAAAQRAAASVILDDNQGT